MKAIQFVASIGAFIMAMSLIPGSAQSAAPSTEPAPGSQAAPPASQTPTAFMDCPLQPNCPSAPPPGAKVISLQLAFEGAMAALDACADIHFGGGSVAVLNNFGIPVIALAQPGARGVDIEVARRKAYTALRNDVSGFIPPPRPAPPTTSTACPSGSACSSAGGVARPTGPDPKFDPLKIPVVRNDPYIYPNYSGHLIKVNGQVLGAIGVTGVPPRDEACAKAGEAYIEEKLR
jgi:uncharacterized protein GlcG (DUF336 family)